LQRNRDSYDDPNYPLGVAFTQDGTKVYVSSLKDTKIYVIDTTTNTIGATIDVGQEGLDGGHSIGAPIDYLTPSSILTTPPSPISTTPSAISSSQLIINSTRSHSITGQNSVNKGAQIAGETVTIGTLIIQQEPKT
jgi:YVTN family beta-propeller protein